MTVPNPYENWEQTCRRLIQEAGGVPCDSLNCSNIVSNVNLHALCNCLHPYENGCLPVRTPGCCVAASSPIFIPADNCFCCCSGLTENLAVAYDASSYKPITDFQLGDPVYVASDTSLRSWSQQPVRFSAGTGVAGTSNTMLKVVFGTPEHNDHLIVNRDQVFLMAGRTLKTAATLEPGVDSLISREGAPHRVLSLENDASTAGLHHIATSTSPATSVEGHLILAKNIVCGDWALQVSVATHTVAAPAS